MKPLKWVIEKRLRKHLVFFSKYQSDFRKSKSTNDHLFHLSQAIIRNFNQGEHIIAPFLDVEKAFNNVWHNGLSKKFTSLVCPRSFVGGSPISLLGESCRSKLKISCLQKFTQKVSHKVQT